MNPSRNPTQILNRLLSRLSPRQRQYAMLATILVGGVGLLWLVFSFTESRPKSGEAKASTGLPSAVTNIGIMPPGGQVNPVDQWVGTAGRKLAQYENERDEQGRLNKDRQAFESKTLQRFADLEQKLTSTQQAALNPPTSLPPALPTMSTPSIGMPPAASLPPLPPPSKASPAAALPGGMPGNPMPMSVDAMPATPGITRITLAERNKSTSATTGAGPDASSPKDARTVSTFLPVSFTRGTLLGGLDAPTGGQSQSNPHPVLIRLSDNSILPNRFRGEYRDCFVVAAGYGDISSERAYLRTESLSCVRVDGATLEVKIQGSVYGEDGKVGMRGRLVTKQGQMLANALLAGVVSGIGQGLSTSSTEYSTSALGTVASAQGADAYRAGVGTGVGRALDRLAQYYIKLAENTFPVIEVDAGREIDVVITKGVRIDVPMTASAATPPSHTSPSPETRYLEVPDDGNY
ncbi:MAG: TrbI/VirB10 family protein [Hydrogenophaga sp.]|uniref:TrbI/VirB10 family protein n=1 Tax=Hydrogenophaga sp. TaxID=1904254 RepID=UPI00275CAC1E|nr:TrbI/VirB10 family protein [Hydrogenophaga sp.]MDP3324932.1 TrbI/VirB10 family protein [Hydrogenophaga sp.]MDZ4177449.1 TrbI/VirB10 family protein [Hydrogenophaga sp.]